jgi:uncharacterized protein YlxW (UPF0749 family)
MEGRKESEEEEKLTKKVEEIKRSLNKKAMELQKIDGKAKAIIDKKKIELTKSPDIFEEIASIGVRGQEIVVSIMDRFQEMRERTWKEYQSKEQKK